MKKLISLVTAGMLAMSLAACGSSGSGSAAAGGSSASSEPTTVTVYCMSFNNIPEDSEVTRIENLMNDYLAKTYPDDNIAIDIKLFGPAEYTQKVQLAMQSGDKIDAFFERAGKRCGFRHAGSDERPAGKIRSGSDRQAERGF